eukprot:scaffold952_cov409-Prasinococcus_capsulatus_cf.AAC.32
MSVTTQREGRAEMGGGVATGWPVTSAAAPAAPLVTLRGVVAPAALAAVLAPWVGHLRRWVATRAPQVGAVTGSAVH